jgi:multiple antibiotic resistance protein
MRRIVEFAASAIVMLLVTIGPLETVAIFGVLTAGARRSMRPRLAIQAVAIAGGVLFVFAIGGTRFLQLLQVSMPAFEVAAGILLLLQSIELIFAHPGGLSALTTGEEIEAERSSEIAVFPLAIPLIAGPASITAAMLLMGQAGADPLRIADFFVALFIRHRSHFRHSARGGCRAVHTRWNTREPSAQMKRHPLKSRDCYVSPAGRLGSFPRYRRRH